MRKIRQVAPFEPVPGDPFIRFLAVSEDGLLYYGSFQDIDDEMHWHAIKGPDDGDPFKGKDERAEKWIRENQRRFPFK